MKNRDFNAICTIFICALNTFGRLNDKPPKMQLELLKGKFDNCIQKSAYTKYLIGSLSQVQDRLLILKSKTDRKNLVLIQNAIKGLQSQSEQFEVQMISVQNDYSQVASEFNSVECIKCTSDNIDSFCDKVLKLNRKIRVLMASFAAIEQKTQHKLRKTRHTVHAVSITNELISRAAKKKEGGINYAPEIARAREFQDKARHAIDAGKQRKAFNLTMKSRDIIEDLVFSVMDSAESQLLTKQAANLIKSTSFTVQNLAAQIDREKNNVVSRRLDHTNHLIENARRSLHRAKLNKALRTLQRVRNSIDNIVLNIYKINTAQERIVRLESRIGHAAKLVQSSDNQETQDIYHKGVYRLKSARKLLETGKEKKASAQLNEAQEFIAKAVDLAEEEMSVR